MPTNNEQYPDPLIELLEALIKNLQVLIGQMEGASRLSDILSDVHKVLLLKMGSIITKKINVSDEDSLIVVFLSNELEVVNGLYQNQKMSNQIKSKWSESLSIIADSIGNYLKIPYFDIIKEIAQLVSIYHRH